MVKLEEVEQSKVKEKVLVYKAKKEGEEGGGEEEGEEREEEEEMDQGRIWRRLRGEYGEKEGGGVERGGLGVEEEREGSKEAH